MLFPILTLFSTATLAASISEINGDKFITSYNGKDVRNVTGLVTAIGPDGFWLRSTNPDDNALTSESIYVYSNTTTNVTTGDVISLDGKVSSYASSKAYIPLTEITKPSALKIQSGGNTVTPIVLGKDNSTSPPTEQYTSLDNGEIFGVPNNSTQVTAANPTLEPSKYGLDFWQSLMGELVTIPSPTAVSKPNSYGDTFVVGSWPVTGRNARGGVTVTESDANPEAILIGSPLDGTKNPKDTLVGAALGDVTGVVYQAFGYYQILPLTALKVTSSPSPALPDATTFNSTGSCTSLTIGDYNIENFASNSTNLDGRAQHIAKYMNSPDIIFLQEIQDDSGPTNDGVVDANKTLDTLVTALSQYTSVKYAYIDIDPANDDDGGQPGGNIRQAYLYNSEVLKLYEENPGGSNDSVQVVKDSGSLKLNFNPGRIEPENDAWKASRKPLVAQWEFVDGANSNGSSTFFTVNVHMTAKLGGTTIESNDRTPVNGGVDQRIQQANLTATFISSILTADSDAAVVFAGDCNEFSFVQPLKDLVSESGLVDIDEAAGIDPLERYTYVYEMNSQELDHIFISEKIAGRSPKVEHVHVNTWVSYSDQVSDHDPSVAQVNVCA